MSVFLRFSYQLCFLDCVCQIGCRRIKITLKKKTHVLSREKRSILEVGTKYVSDDEDTTKVPWDHLGQLGLKTSTMSTITIPGWHIAKIWGKWPYLTHRGMDVDGYNIRGTLWAKAYVVRPVVFQDYTYPMVHYLSDSSYTGSYISDDCMIWFRDT